MLVYKVVRRVEGRLYSFSNETDLCRVEYKLDEYVDAPGELWALGYGICVFRDREQALNFAKSYCYRSEVVVFEAECQNIWVPHVPMMFISIDSIDDFKGLLCEILSCYDRSCDMPLSGNAFVPNTLMTDRLKLVKEIECFSKWY